MQVTDRATPGRLPVRLVELRERVGSYLERPDGARLVLFRRDGQRSSRPLTIDVPGPGKTGILVTDLTPGAWRARRSNESNSHEIRVSQELGAAWFEASPGTWHLDQASRAGD
jgi:hypothetical protein